jgi:hypothetical protein
MDTVTKAHFDKWLMDAESADVREAVRKLMLAVYEDDPEYWSQSSWPALRSAAVSQDTYNRLMAEARLQAAIDDMAN